MFAILATSFQFPPCATLFPLVPLLVDKERDAISRCFNGIQSTRISMIYQMIQHNVNTWIPTFNGVE